MKRSREIALQLSFLLSLSALTVTFIVQEIRIERAQEETANAQEIARLAASNADGWKTLASFWKSLAAELAASDARCTDPIRWEGR